MNLSFRRRGLAALMVLAVCCVVSASTPWVDIEQRLTPEQRHATGLDTLQPAQLALLNRLLREDAERTAAAVPPPPAGAPVASAPAASAEARADANASSGRFLGFNDGPIVTRLVGTLTGWEPGTEFQLANGQRWKVLKGHYTLRKPLESPEVRVVPGAAGRWFFRIDDDTPGARVYRID